MKKVAITVAFAAVLAFGLAACGGSSSSSSSAASDSNAASAGLANPWSEAGSAEAAAKGAGLDSFVVPDSGTMADNGPIDLVAFRFMDGIAEAEGGIGAAILTVRKGADPAEDISGDFNNYKYNWTQDVDGIEVNCSGNEEGRATKATWVAGGHSFAILAFAQGDDPMAFGVNEEDLALLVGSIE